MPRIRRRYSVLVHDAVGPRRYFDWVGGEGDPDLSSMRRLALSLALGILSTPAYAQAPSPLNPAREFVVGEAQGLRVVAWIKDEASLADDEWFRLDITNTGPDLVVRSAAILASGRFFNNTDSELTLPLDLPAGRRAGSFDMFVIPTGRFATSVPGTFFAWHLGSRRFREFVLTMRLKFRTEPLRSSGRGRGSVLDEIILSGPDTITLRWLRPDAGQVEELKRQAASFVRRAFDPSNPLSLADGVKLRALLGMSEVRASLPIDDVLAANRRRQQSEWDFEYSEMRGILFERFQTDRKVVAFYQEALRERGPAAIRDLSDRGSPPWDDSLLEPIVSLLERISRDPSPRPWELQSTMIRALEYLDRTRSRRPDDPAIASRLSAAVLRFMPAPDPVGMSTWTSMLVMTRDHDLIKVLRPYLSDGTVVTSEGSMILFSGVTPMRYSELAANAICLLLGEPLMVVPWERAKAPSGGPYPEWAEWDKRLAALRKRLDAMR